MSDEERLELAVLGDLTFVDTEAKRHGSRGWVSGFEPLMNWKPGMTEMLKRLSESGHADREMTPWERDWVGESSHPVYAITPAGRARLEELRQMARDAKEGDER